MMMKRYLRLLALCAFFVPATILAAGCGGVAGNAVAEVDGEAIDKQDFEHWINVASKSGTQGAAAAPVPPDFKACIAAARKVKPAEGQPKQTDAQLKTQCKQQYDQLRDQVLSLLISFEWIDREAVEQGVKVTEAEITKGLEEQRKASFPKEADYKKFLKDSGYTEADLRRRVRLGLLSDKIRDKIIKGKDKVSDAQITAYYDKNKARFATPETRDLSIVLTKNEARAKEALAALRSGESFKSVVKEYSIDDTSKASGGKLPAVAQGQQEKAFDEAIFSAAKGKITGPVKTQFGWYVFKVDKITKASQQTRDEAAETIKQTLATENQQKALDAFVKDFRAEWREKTECREGYLSQDCKNGPKPTPTPTPGTEPPVQ